MQKRIQQFLVVILSLLLILPILAGCNTAVGPTDPTASVPSEPSATEPPATDPPATEPPATDPPATEPPATEPPATEPPATEPPATEPPATEPPATEPPATEPPATEPPAPENDIGKPITNDEFTVTVTKVEQENNRYVVTLNLTYAGEKTHTLSAKSRFFIVNSSKRSLEVTDILDPSGDSIMSGSIAAGQTLTITAIFDLTEGFEPVAFRYVYDINGFRRVQVAL